MEKLPSEGGIEILKAERGWGLQASLGELQEQAECVAVGGQRVGTCLTLAHEPICEESLLLSGPWPRREKTPQTMPTREGPNGVYEADGARFRTVLGIVRRSG